MLTITLFASVSIVDFERVFVLLFGLIVECSIVLNVNTCSTRQTSIKQVFSCCN